MKSIVEAVFGHASENPERMCIIDEQCALTYKEVCGRTMAVAEYLRGMGAKKGDMVIVECTQDARFLIADLALEIMGAVFVPVEMNVSSERLESIKTETGAEIYISGDKMPEFEELSLAEWDGSFPEFPESSSVAEILYTTGTTGKAKGIVLTHANNIAVAENIIDGTKMKPLNVELVPLPISHSHGLRTSYANLLNAGTIVIVNGVMRVKKWIKLLKEYNVTSLDLSPTAARALIKVTRGNMKEFEESLDYIEIGTAALDEDLKTSLCELLPLSRLYNFYGSTEAGRVCTYDFNAEKGLVNCIGYPTQNATFAVTDEDRKPIKSDIDNMGLLAIKGSMNMAKYFKAPELTKDALRDGYILTNDIGYIDENGKVYMIGRKGSVINYMGIKIAPEEIESVADKYDGISDCACVPAKDANGFEVPKLFVVPCGSADDFDRQALRDFLKSQLEANKLPQIVETIDVIPRASNGKILRKELV